MIVIKLEHYTASEIIEIPIAIANPFYGLYSRVASFREAIVETSGNAMYKLLFPLYRRF